MVALASAGCSEGILPSASAGETPARQPPGRRRYGFTTLVAEC